MDSLHECRDLRMSIILSAPDEAQRLLNDRLDLVVREDSRDLTRISSWKGVADLVELLRDRVLCPGTP